jgi:hypothetical protein
MTRKFAAGLFACGLALQGCGLDQVTVPGSLVGPSELGISLEMVAIPDILTADGIQTSVIRAVVRDSKGAPAPGKAIVFTIADELGRTAEIGTLTSDSGARVFGATSRTTNAQGIAQVVYTTPERRDFTADARIVVGARPVGTDANGAPYTTLRIELRSAEPRRFPQTTTGAPTCAFIWAPNNPVVREGSVLRFSSTSFVASPGYIVRYEWYFGDGTTAVGDEGHIEFQKGFPFAGTFTVTHIVTSNTGGQASCDATITVVP